VHQVAFHYTDETGGLKHNSVHVCQLSIRFYSSTLCRILKFGIRDLSYSLQQ